MKLQRVANYAVRRACGMDVYIMQEFHVHDKHMYAAAKWPSIEETVMKLSMQWLGHVARMPTIRVPKQALFGWMATSGGNASVNFSQTA